MSGLTIVRCAARRQIADTLRTTIHSCTRAILRQALPPMSLLRSEEEALAWLDELAALR